MFLFYTIFINNIYNFLPFIERHQTPFVFTLYPGGGFQIDNSESDKKIRTVFSSKYFKKVIVTQKNTRDYLIGKNFCPENKIGFIYGGVLPSDYYKEHAISKKYYKKEKNTLDICFVANKYMEKGLDKGFDVFIEVAKNLCEKTKDIFFHVVSGCGEKEINVDDIKNRIKFYGLQYRDFFPEFYSKMDIILSPNRPYILLPGSFDGFPTGSCAEAGLAGVAVFCSDELNMNVKFKDGEDIKIIPVDASAIAHTILRYHEESEELYGLASECQKSFQREFGINYQMGKRYEILKNNI
ncbi:MAG TPA: glycosyltransferase, partial [Candidatus Kapabacteria bacterium]|nr:glycosyltransferase [Candidatus Kapabacteria bacterium]